MVGPLIGTRDRLSHQHVPLVSPPDEDIIQQVPVSQTRVHQGSLLSRRKTEGVGQDEAVFCAGCTRIRTAAFHPATNLMVERFHCQLKISLRAAVDAENLTDHPPLVLLGICSALRPDLDCSAAQLVFGVTVRLPGEMISSNPHSAVEDPTNLLHHLRQFVRTLPRVPHRSSASLSYLEKDLVTCSHVYLQFD
nr:unnamed protein product [Spirometra erinaceieuropaei]